MPRRLEWWKTDGTIIQLPDPEKHGAPSFAALCELVKDDDIGWDRYLDHAEGGKRRRYVVYSSNATENPNPTVAEHFHLGLNGDVVVADTDRDVRHASGDQADDE